jgi:hypothetical protein
MIAWSNEITFVLAFLGVLELWIFYQIIGYAD